MTNRRPDAADVLEALCEVGAALYGERWQSPLARDLGVSDRTMRRWVNGAWDKVVTLPEGLPRELAKLVELRIHSTEALRKRVVRLQRRGQ